MKKVYHVIRGVLGAIKGGDYFGSSNTLSHLGKMVEMVWLVRTGRGA